MYKRLSIIEIVYCKGGTIISKEAERIILEQLGDLREQMYCISIVCDGNSHGKISMENFIRQIRMMNLPISITCVDCYNYSILKSVKEDVAQIRIYLGNEKVEESFLLQVYNELKEEHNNIIFLLDLCDKGTASYYFQLLDQNNFIFTATYNHHIEPQTYWTIAHCVSSTKEVHPSKIFVDFTCGGAEYENIRGICPARNFLMCIDTSGKIKYCYKDSIDHGLSLNDGSFNELFLSLSNMIPSCTHMLCSGDQHRQCLGGCPLDMFNGINKFCRYKSF